MTQDLSRKVAREFRRKIASGQWAAGTKLPSVRQLAAEYNVSINTVQNAFRELEGSELVERRPRQGGYVKAKSNGTPVRTHELTVAVISGYDETSASEKRDDWSAGIIQGCTSELAGGGHHVTLLSYGKSDAVNLEPVLAHLERVREGLAGALCFMRPGAGVLLDELDRRDIPWVTVNKSSERAGQNFVATENFKSARLMGGCFARMGLGRVAVLSDPIETGRSAGDKLFGCIQGYIESGGQFSNVSFIEVPRHMEESGFEAFRRYLASGVPVPRAVLASGDVLALGAIRACREAGLRVPDDVALVGTTGMQAAAFSHPSLTVLEVPMEQMGREAARMLLEMSREGVRRMMGRFVPGRLIQRDSFRIPDAVLTEITDLIARRP